MYKRKCNPITSCEKHVTCLIVFYFICMHGMSIAYTCPFGKPSKYSKLKPSFLLST